MFCTLSGFDDDVVHVYLDFLVDHVVKEGRRGPHVSSTDILEAERHEPIIVNSSWRSERCLLLIFLMHQDLMVPDETINK